MEMKDKYKNIKREGVVDFTEESDSKSNKAKNHKSYDFMNKLELFSDVWNDCASVPNPKENVESWYGKNSKPNIGHYMEVDSNKLCKRAKWNEFDSVSNSATFRTSRNKPTEKDTHSFQQLDENETNKPKLQEENSTVCNYTENSQQDTGNHNSNISDLKRKKAVQEHSKLHNDKKNIIKQALSSMDGKGRSNKKIVFGDAEDVSKIKNSVAKDEKSTSGQKLFGDDESDVETDFNLNHQFKGRKGQKLFELQSKFASDSRFALDTRFYESGSDEDENETRENMDHEEEKKRQLEILEDIVKQPIKPLSEMKWKKEVYSDTTYLRFDPTREDHKKYIIIQPDKKTQEEDGSEKRRKKNKKKELEGSVEANKTKVTADKFVAVKEDLKEALKKDGSGTEFSLLKLFGPKASDELTSREEQSQTLNKLKYKTRNPFKYDSSDSEPEKEEIAESSTKEENKKGVARQAKASWRTTFFLSDEDPRLEEALEFLKCPEEQENNEEFAEKRKMLKDFIRHKFKNSNRKKSLFKKKLGGFKKKAFQKKKGKRS